MPHKKQLFTRLRHALQRVYGTAEKLYRKRFVRKRKWSKFEIDLINMNSIFKKYYKRPEMHITDFENISKFWLETSDGKKMSCIKYEPNPGSKKYVITSHWYAGHKYLALYHGLIFAKMGYNMISMDYRGHGYSDKDTTTMGPKEINDLRDLISYVSKNFEYDELALYGISMGAFYSTYVTSVYPEECKNAKIKYAIADCPYGSIYNVMLHAKNTRFKLVPKLKTKALLNKLLEDIRDYEKEQGFEFENVDVIKKLKEGSKPACPMLFLHSLDDKITPVTDTLKIMLHRKDKIAGDEYKIYEYSTHTQAARIHFKSYYRTIGQFIAKMDDTNNLYEDLVKEWKLDEITSKNDIKSKKME